MATELMKDEEVASLFLEDCGDLIAFLAKDSYDGNQFNDGIERAYALGLKRGKEQGSGK